MQEHSLFSTPFPAFIVYRLFNDGHCDWCEVISHCSFDLHFSKGNPICLTADLSAKTLQARRECQDIFKILKRKNLQPRLLYPARISFKIDGEIKSFSDKQKLREFSTTKPALQQMDLYGQEIQEKKKDLQNQPQTIRK